MRNIIVCSFGVLAATAFLGAAPAAQAANTGQFQAQAQAQAQEACAGSRIPGTQRCAGAASAVPTPVPGLVQVVNGGFDRNSCHRLPSKVARDTCLNHVDGSA